MLQSMLKSVEKRGKFCIVEGLQSHSCFYAELSAMLKNTLFFQKISQDVRWVTVPNILTLLRILLAPVMVISMYHGYLLFAFFVFVIASVTDVLDGFFARWCDVGTNLGKMLDPVADKVLLISVFCALSFLQLPLFQIPVWFFMMIVVREVIMLVGSWVILWIDPQASLEPIIWGKLTTFFQILFVIWVFTCYFFGWEPKRIYILFLVLLALFSLLSLLQYMKIGFRYFRKTPNN